MIRTTSSLEPIDPPTEDLTIIVKSRTFFVPYPQTIEAACARIQQTWDDAERERRTIGDQQQGWMPPVLTRDHETPALWESSAENPNINAKSNSRPTTFIIDAEPRAEGR